MKRRNDPREPRLGVDIGRVIIDGSSHPDGGDTAFFQGDEATLLRTPEVPGASAAIARLVTLFDGRVWLVSKCGPKIQERTLRWLAGNDFYGRTGLWRANVRFCRTRPDKRIHCVQLGLTHFVDDHPEVHTHIHDVVAYQYFFGPQRSPVPAYGRHTSTWADVERLIGESLAAPVGGATAEPDQPEGPVRRGRPAPRTSNRR